MTRSPCSTRPSLRRAACWLAAAAFLPLAAAAADDKGKQGGGPMDSVNSVLRDVGDGARRAGQNAAAAAKDVSKSIDKAAKDARDGKK
jgi:hypothetical protein